MRSGCFVPARDEAFDLDLSDDPGVRDAALFTVVPNDAQKILKRKASVGPSFAHATPGDAVPSSDAPMLWYLPALGLFPWVNDLSTFERPLASQQASRDSQSLAVIMNDRGLGDPVFQQELRRIELSGIELIRLPVTETGEAREHARRAAEQRVSTIVACGGDGTVNEVLNGMLDSGEQDPLSSQLGIIPFGTANDFARAIGIPDASPIQALEVILTTPSRWIDLGKINGHYFINTATAGFCAEVTTNTPPEIKRLLGGLAYFVSGIQQMSNLCPRELRIESEEMSWRGPALAVFASNGRTTGGGFQIAPRAWLDDERLDIMIIPELSLVEFLPAWEDYLKLGEEQAILQRLVRFQSRHVNIESQDELQFNIDGEPLRGTSFLCESHARAIRVHAPAVAPIRQPIEWPESSE